MPSVNNDLRMFGGHNTVFFGPGPSAFIPHDFSDKYPEILSAIRLRMKHIH